MGQRVRQAGGAHQRMDWGALSHSLLLIPVIDFDETEAERVDEEKEDRRQDLTTVGLGKGSPG